MELVIFKDLSDGRKYEFVEIIDGNLHDSINTIKHVDLFWSKTSFDYQFAVDHIKSLGDASGGFGNLTSAEKLIYSKNGLATKAESDGIGVTDQDRISYNESVGELLSLARRNRFVNAMKRMNSEVLDGNMTSVSMGLLYDDIVDMANKYITIGDDRLLDWITSSGIFTALTGFKSKPYYSAEREQILTDKIINGIP